MSTPTTVKFQIAVPSTDGTEKTYTLTLSLLVEGSVEGEGEIRVTPILASETSESDAPEPAVLPAGDAPLPKDPPVH